MRAGMQESAVEPDVELERIADDRIVDMAAAGCEVIEVHSVLAKTGDNVVAEILRGHDSFYEWDHYPAGDVYDAETQAQYYYHAHAAEERFDGEHGHFHTFLRPKGMPPGCVPAAVPDFTSPQDPNDALSHLVAIAMDRHGLPFRLFTVNRWVTGETWYAGADVVRMLDRFEIGHARPSWPVNRWIGAMIRLFRPQIEQLVSQRDETLAAWQQRYQDRDVFEDRTLEVTSYLDIDVEAQAHAVERERRRRGG